MRSQLLCTFCNKKDYESSLIQISNAYTIAFDKIYVLENEDDDYQMFLTYNASVSSKSDFLPKTISVHRKKHTNSLYTINALNRLIIDETGGIDEHYEVDWEEYKNCIILTSDDGYRIVPTRLYKIVNL